MSKVIPFKQRIYEIENCAGCKKEIGLDELYHEVKMPYRDYIKHIALCKKCYNKALENNIKFINK